MTKQDYESIIEAIWMHYPKEEAQRLVDELNKSLKK